MMPPIRVVASIVPAKLLNPKPGVYVYDMGQTISGLGASPGQRTPRHQSQPQVR